MGVREGRGHREGQEAAGHAGCLGGGDDAMDPFLKTFQIFHFQCRPRTQCQVHVREPARGASVRDTGHGVQYQGPGARDLLLKPSGFPEGLPRHGKDTGRVAGARGRGWGGQSVLVTAPVSLPGAWPATGRQRD